MMNYAALETGWGRSSMAKPPMNTLFNIKCTATKSRYQKGCSEVASWEYDSNGRRYLKVSGFRTYANTGDSLKDFGLFLTSLSRYRAAFDHTDDPDAFLREVHRAGYATDPNYTTIVTGIMRDYNLYQYDVRGKNDLGDTSKLPITTKDYVFLSYGYAGQSVTTLQRLLNDGMGRNIELTGRYGVETQDAVAFWQYSRPGFPTISGEVDTETWKDIVPTLRPGDKGPKVRALQLELRHAGYTMLPVNDSFDSFTREAVLDFQRRHKLPVVGTVSTQTWGRLLGN